MVNIDKIKNLAREKGIKIKYICSQVDRAETYLSNIKNGKDKMTPERLKKIAELLGTTPEYLSDQTEQKEKPVIYDDEREAVIYKLNVLMNQMETPQLERFIEIVRFAALSDSDFEKLKQFAQIFLPDSPQE